MPEPEPKPEPQPVPIDLTKVDWAKWGGPLLICAGLVFLGFRVAPSPGPTPTPLPPAPVVIEQPRFDPIDTIAKLNGKRLDPEKTKLYCDAANNGDGTITLEFTPVGKETIVRKVTVSGGVVPPKPDPVNPVDPVPPVVDPTTKPTAAIYVYEKDQGGVPSAVMSGLNRLNREKKILATAFEQDSKDGSGDVPEQYKVPLDEAKKAGLPSLVLMADKTFLKAVKAPKTEAEVVGVVQ